MIVPYGGVFSCTFMEDITLVLDILSENKCCFGSWIFVRLTQRGNDQVLFPSQRYVLLLFKGVKRLGLGFCSKWQFICCSKELF